MPQPIIIAKNFSVLKNGNPIFENIDFSLSAGNILLVSGIAGSGKTMLANALRGKAKIAGQLTTTFQNNDPTLAPAITYVAQRYEVKNRSNLTSGFYYQQRFTSSDVNDCYSIWEELTNTNAANETTIHLLMQFGIWERKDASIIELSSGEHKRFQLVKAFANATQLMILDEPFLGLDVNSRDLLTDLIQEYTTKGIAFIILAGGSQATIQNLSQRIELQPLSAQKLEDKFDFLPEKIRWEENSLPDYQNTLRLSNVTVKYGEKTILDHINWTVKKGERWCIKGHNGAGKSTLLSLITGDNPQIYSNDINLFDKKRGGGLTIWDLKKNIGFFSPEKFAFYDKSISVFNTVAGGLFDTMGLYKRLNETQRQQVISWLEVFRLEKEKDQPLNTLSLGRQRLALMASALVKSPELLLLDEPCQGLDAKQTMEFVNIIDLIANRIDNTIIYISHYESEIPKSILRELRLDHGKATIINKERTQLSTNE